VIAPATLTVLGSGTAVPVAERGPAGLLLEAGGERVLVDAGSGTLGRMARAGVTPDRLDRVFFTHFHLDHFADFAPLLFSFVHPALDRDRTLVVTGPRGLGEKLDGLRRLFPGWLEPARTRLALVEVEPGWRARLPFATVSAGPTRHVPGAVAYRFAFEDGRSLVVSGDTAYDEGFVAFARGADLLVLECALERATERDVHLDADGAGRVAAEAAPVHLLLTHFYPEVRLEDVLARVGRRFFGRATLAHDGASFTV